MQWGTMRVRSDMSRRLQTTLFAAVFFVLSAAATFESAAPQRRRSTSPPPSSSSTPAMNPLDSLGILQPESIRSILLLYLARNMTKAKVAQLEADVKDKPEDIDSRLSL